MVNKTDEAELQKRHVWDIDQRRCIICVSPFQATGETVYAVFSSAGNESDNPKSKVIPLVTGAKLGYYLPEGASPNPQPRRFHNQFYYAHLSCLQVLYQGCVDRKKRLPSIEELVKLGKILDRDHKGRSKSSMYLRLKKEFASAISDRQVLSFVESERECELLRTIMSLPTEIRLLVARQVEPCPLTSTVIVLCNTIPLLDHIRTLWKEPKVEKLYVTLPIYISYISIGADKYIYQCSNKPSHPSQFASVVDSTINQVKFIVDDIGVREINFVSREDRLSRHQTLPEECWLRAFTYSGQRSLTSVRVHSDMLLRDTLGHPIYLTESPPWNVTNPPPLYRIDRFSSGIHTGTHTGDFTKDQRLCYLSCENNPQGITISCGKGSSWTVHVHPQGIEPTVAYEDIECNLGMKLVWIYFPLAAGEGLSDVWIRRINQGMGMFQPCVLIRTTHGRSCTFGPYFDLGFHIPYQIKELRAKTPGIIRGLIHDVRGIGSMTIGTKFGVEYTGQTFHGDHSRRSPEIQRAFSLPMSTDYWEHPNINWYLSKADLNTVLSAQLCSEERSGRVRCLGVQFELQNSRIVLGQWRFDKRISRVFSSPTRMCFREELSRHHPYVYDLCFDDSDNTTTEEATEDGKRVVPLKGKIEWWFGNLGTKVFWAAPD